MLTDPNQFPVYPLRSKFQWVLSNDYLQNSNAGVFETPLAISLQCKSPSCLGILTCGFLSDALELQSQPIVHCLMLVLGIVLEFSARAARTLDHQTISLAPENLHVS